MSAARLTKYHNKYPLAMADAALNGLPTVKDMNSVNEARLRAALRALAPPKPRGFPTATHTVELCFGTDQYDRAGTWLKKVRLPVIQSFSGVLVLKSTPNSAELLMSRLPLHLPLI